MDAKEFVRFEHYPEATCSRHNVRFTITTPSKHWTGFKLLSGYHTTEEAAWRSAARRLGWKESDNLHTHKCPNCGHIWEHGGDSFDIKAAHTCVKCGTEVWDKHHARITRS